MQLKFNHTTQHLVDLFVFYSWSAPWKKKTRQKMAFLIPIAFVLFGLALWVDNASTALSVTLYFLAACWLLLYDKLYKYRLAYFAKGYFNHEVNERLWETQYYDFKEDYIFIQNTYVEAKLQWRAIVNVIEQDEVFWLFESHTRAHIIPKLALKGKENEFKQLMAKKLLAGNQEG